MISNPSRSGSSWTPWETVCSESSSTRGTPSASIRSRHVWSLCFGSITSLAECQRRLPRSSNPGCFPTHVGSNRRYSATIAWMFQGTSLRAKLSTFLPRLTPFLCTFRARTRSSSSGRFEKGPARATTDPRLRGSRRRGWQPGLDGSRSLVFPCPHMLTALHPSIHIQVIVARARYDHSLGTCGHSPRDPLLHPERKSEAIWDASDRVPYK